MTHDKDLLGAVEEAVDAGAALLREGRWHSGSKIAKGDRDYATEVDVRIEETIRTALEKAAPGIGFLGEEEEEEAGRRERGALGPRSDRRHGQLRERESSVRDLPSAGRRRGTDPWRDRLALA